jgi:hypothetical protein
MQADVFERPRQLLVFGALLFGSAGLAILAADFGKVLLTRHNAVIGEDKDVQLGAGGVFST